MPALAYPALENVVDYGFSLPKLNITIISSNNNQNITTK
jgi:hypothetical protein